MWSIAKICPWLNWKELPISFQYDSKMRLQNFGSWELSKEALLPAIAVFLEKRPF